MSESTSEDEKENNPGDRAPLTRYNPYLFPVCFKWQHKEI